VTFLTFRRCVSALLTAVFALSAVMTGTLGWAGFNQNALNESRGRRELFPAELVKFEKTADGEGTEIPVSGAEFYLFTSDGTQIGGRYVTGSNGRIKVSLRLGNYYFEETNPGLGWDYDTTPDGSRIKRYPFTVTGENMAVTAVTAYNRRTSGSLTLEKIVENANGSELTDEQSALEFEFTVTFSDEGTYSYAVDGGEPAQLTSGGTLKLKHDQKAVFAGIPAGVFYTISETPAADYTFESTGASDNIPDPASGLPPAVAAFTNTFRGGEPPGALTDLTILKEIAGEVPEPFSQNGFEFRVTLTLPEETELPVVIQLRDGYFPLTVRKTEFSITLKNGERAVFNRLPYGTVYEVVENNYWDDGFSSRVAAGYGVAGGGTVTDVCTNTFVGEITVDIGGEKTWALPAVDSGQWSVDGLKPESITVRLKNGDKVVSSATVTPDESGHWNYHWNVPKYEPDGVSEIHYTVEELPVTGWKPVYDGFNIKNICIPPVIGDEIPVEKTLAGDTPAVYSQFRFVLTALDGAPLPEHWTTDHVQLTITGAGTASFGKITYTAAGTYVYTITERNTSAEGYTYDESVYTYTVSVAEENGRMAIKSKTLSKAGQPVEKAVFTNQYTKGTPPRSGKVTISGTKTWNHGHNYLSEYPKAITVILRVNGALLIQKQITETDHWYYSFVLDKYDAQGNELVYTVDEVKVPGYDKTVNGYDLINTYNPDSPDNPGGSGTPGAPKTSDDSRTVGWLIMMCVSFAGLAVLALCSRIGKKKRYVPLH
jgi:pilin isopeptide linkage protein